MRVLNENLYITCNRYSRDIQISKNPTRTLVGWVQWVCIRSIFKNELLCEQFSFLSEKVCEVERCVPYDVVCALRCRVFV